MISKSKKIMQLSTRLPTCNVAPRSPRVWHTWLRESIKEVGEVGKWIAEEDNISKAVKGELVIQVRVNKSPVLESLKEKLVTLHGLEEVRFDFSFVIS